MATKAPKKRVRRGSFWFRLHSYIGLNFALLLSFVFLTGTLAVVASEIDWLVQPEMRVAPASVDGLNWPAMAEQAARHAPDQQIELIQAPASAIFAASVYVRDGDGRRSILYAHPSTGEIQGEGSLLTVKSLVRQLHRNLFLPDTIGIPLITLLGFILLVSLISAMMLYRRWWRGFFRWPRRDRGKRRYWGDLHRLMGVWSLGFGLVIGLTASWYFVEQLAVPAPGFGQVEISQTKQDVRTPGISLARALSEARKAYPRLAIRQVQWPDGAQPAYRFTGQDGTWLVRDRAAGVAIDARSGGVVLQHAAGDATLHQRVSEAADPLHMGNFAGYWSKALWFLFGLLLTALTLSGAWVCLKRLARERRATEQGLDALHEELDWHRFRSRFGVGLGLALAAVLVALFALPAQLDLWF